MTVDVRDYNLWTKEPMPVFLVVYDAMVRRAFWLYVQHYFESNPARRPKTGARSVRVRIPVENAVDEAFVRYARERKVDVLGQLAQEVVHRGS